MPLIEKLKTMLDARQSDLKQHGIDIEIFGSADTTDKSSIHADFVANKYMARITLWDTGECDMEILDVDSGETTFYIHYEFDQKEGLEQAVETFIRRLSL